MRRPIRRSGSFRGRKRWPQPSTCRTCGARSGWGRVWTLATWCEARGDFRSFRVDQIAEVRDTGRVARPETGRDLAA
ncbi:WYL domain-containing protein [Paragemmobacter ruber]|uniref:WYL domain-containing protein n=1 Tax=Paragemmobacter ruber TaxID=1985673 RepID=UPI002E29D8C4|nr:WYL domain-containing protein [Rhodobacter ruber]